MKINFIDLFSGIGGFRLGFEQAAAELGLSAGCVFSSEKDKFARQTYLANWGDEPSGDFSLIDYSTIPKHSVCLASTSCQPFSQAGKGLKGNDPRNTIPYLLNYIAVCMPPVLIHENVVELRNSQEYKQMLYTLDKLGYTVFDRVYNSISVTPQNRSRLFTVAFKDFNFAFAFEWPELPELNFKMRDILEEDVPDKYTLKDKTWLCLQRKVGEYYRKWKPELLDAVRESCGLTAETGGGMLIPPDIRKSFLRNGFGYRIAGLDDTGGTLLARYKKDGAEILIEQQGKNPRIMTPRECARYMGFPDSFKISVSDYQAYKQFGNAVVPGVVKEIAKAVIRAVGNLKKERKL